MADFFAEIKAGVTAAEKTFGDSFTINGNKFMPLKGFFSKTAPPDAAELGVFQTDSDAFLEAGRKQFDDLGLAPKEGDTITIDSVDYRAVRLNADRVTFEFILRRKDT